ncbi:MAG: hypothetical protein BWY76_03460 [bacterium ADurb.Bin429]|nr:MAG: hypothetical protein BWY76_03460 [bacterium ADurb.Bin429]
MLAQRARRHRDKGAQALAARAQPLPRDGFRRIKWVILRRHGTEQRLERCFRECRRRLAQQRDVAADTRRRFFRPGIQPRAHLIPLRFGIEAAVVEQRYGDIGDAEVGHAQVGFLQRLKASDTKDGVRFPLQHLHQYRGGAFRHDDLIPQRLSFHLDAGDIAALAAGAVQADTVIAPGAAGGVAQAVRQQQQPTREGHRGKRPLPEGVIRRHHGETEIGFRQLQRRQRSVSPPLQRGARGDFRWGIGRRRRGGMANRLPQSGVNRNLFNLGQRRARFNSHASDDFSTSCCIRPNASTVQTTG